MLAGADDLHDRNHVLQCLTPEAVEPPTSIAVLDGQARFLEHPQMKRRVRLWHTHQLRYLGLASFPLGKGLQDVESGGVRRRMKPLGDGPELNLQRVRKTWQPRPAEPRCFGEAKPKGAAHGHHPPTDISTTVDMRCWGG